MSGFNRAALTTLLAEYGRDTLIEQGDFSTAIMDFGQIPGKDKKDSAKIFDKVPGKKPVGRVNPIKGGLASGGITKGGATRRAARSPCRRTTLRDAPTGVTLAQPSSTAFSTTQSIFSLAASDWSRWTAMRGARSRSCQASIRADAGAPGVQASRAAYSPPRPSNSTIGAPSASRSTRCAWWAADAGSSSRVPAARPGTAWGQWKRGTLMGGPWKGSARARVAQVAPRRASLRAGPAPGAQ